MKSHRDSSDTEIDVLVRETLAREIDENALSRRILTNLNQTPVAPSLSERGLMLVSRAPYAATACSLTVAFVIGFSLSQPSRSSASDAWIAVALGDAEFSMGFGIDARRAIQGRD